MKKHILTILPLVLGGLFISATFGFAQGSLTPPGAPAPTMKTLAQIEPRIAITTTGAITISQPGSYYLTTNITVSSGNAIIIATNNVTLDLNGFFITSTAPSATGMGIMLNGNITNIAVYNGSILSGVTNSNGIYGGAGFGSGIDCTGTPYNVRVSKVSVAGCLGNGIFLGYSSTVVDSCVVNTAGSDGIVAVTVSDSVADNCGSLGIYTYGAHNCYANGYQGYGIISNGGVENCYGGSVNGYGIIANTVQNSYGFSTTGVGVRACSAINCLGASSGNVGVYGFQSENCQGSSTSSSGVYAYVANNCYGFSNSGIGVNAVTANGCYGTSASATAVYSTVANACYCSSSTSTGLNSYIATACRATGSPAETVTYKYNMP